MARLTIGDEQELESSVTIRNPNEINQIETIINQTTIINESGGGGGSNSTYNATYDLWSYNQTIASGWLDDGTDVHLITSSDDVGIGDSTPNFKLELAMDGGETEYFGISSDSSGGSNGDIVQFTDGGWLYNNIKSPSLDFTIKSLTSTTEALIVNVSVGMVGINVSYPSKVLDVGGNGDFSGNLYVGSGNELVNKWLYNQTEAGDNRFLKLDASNDPITADLNVTADVYIEGVLQIHDPTIPFASPIDIYQSNGL